MNYYLKLFRPIFHKYINFHALSGWTLNFINNMYKYLQGFQIIICYEKKLYGRYCRVFMLLFRLIIS